MLTSPAPGTIADRLALSSEVAAALAAGRPVVALESTLISHGLPYPSNLEVARASEAAVRESGAVPATIAIRDGRLLVGLDDTELEALATSPAGSVLKAARPSLSAALTRPGWAATTVSATMIVAHAAGIKPLHEKFHHLAALGRALLFRARREALHMLSDMIHTPDYTLVDKALLSL